MSTVKQQVREFYDQVGWQEVGEDVYQNAHYEDLRPVSREYIHRCHQRVALHLNPGGDYLLDAGSGPIQYPDYLEYSRGYRARVCADVSIVALREARRRIGDRQSGGHGLFVVADIAHLPFKARVFEGTISLHTIHHLPEEEQLCAYTELYRTLAPGATAVVVNGWQASPLMQPFVWPVRRINRLRKRLRRLLRAPAGSRGQDINRSAQKAEKVKGTHVSKKDSARFKAEVRTWMLVEILVWRSVSVAFLRAFIHPRLGGKWFLRLLYRLEERFPHFFGEYGQYPLIVVRKTGKVI